MSSFLSASAVFVGFGAVALLAACSDGRLAAATGGDPAAEDAGIGGTEQACLRDATKPCWDDGTGRPLLDSTVEVQLGACKPGQRRCSSDRTWGECLGTVGPTAADTCSAGDDSTCNGIPNEGCACLAGEVRECVDACGQQTCAEDGTWGACSGGACAAGNVETKSVTCGACGAQMVRRACDDHCNWQPWEDVGPCTAEEECTVGSEETRQGPCGNCGTQPELRKCTDYCSWGPWLPTGDSCVGTGACAPGELRGLGPVACGYCGLQGRVETCSDNCAWEGQTVDHACLEEDCASSPGDEQVGVVHCWRDTEGSCSDTCCVSLTSATCGEVTCGADQEHECDGPEDCGGSNCCARALSNDVAYGQCSADACETRFCHVDSDCDPGFQCRHFNGIGYCRAIE